MKRNVDGSTQAAGQLSFGQLFVRALNAFRRFPLLTKAFPDTVQRSSRSVAGPWAVPPDRRALPVGLLPAVARPGAPRPGEDEALRGPAGGRGLLQILPGDIHRAVVEQVRRARCCNVWRH